MYDVIVVGGGFAGVAAAREIGRGGGRALLLEARDRLGGRTWTAPWRGRDIEYGGGWVHWHQPHTWSEIRRHGLAVSVSDEADRTLWHVGDELRSGTVVERDAIARRGWDRFVGDVGRVLPRPHDPLFRRDELARLDGLTIAERMAEIELDDEERAVLAAELESLANGFLDDAGAVSVLRWHALSGYSLELTQYTGGRVTLVDGTRALVEAIAEEVPFARRFGVIVHTITQRAGVVEVETVDGVIARARGVVVAVPLNTLGAISFEPGLSETKRAAVALGQASRGIKIFLHVRGRAEDVNAIRAGHPFGYLATETIDPDGTQMLIGFGRDAAACDAGDLRAVQRQLEEIIPGYEVMAATAHDWLGDELARGTWAIHRPGWYTRFHAEMQQPEGRVILAGSDLADGWAGFMDGAIESGVRVGREACRWIER
jgi:monoamine oxidase